MLKPIAALTIALIIVGCSEDRQVNSDKPVSLVGTYKGVMETDDCSWPERTIWQVDSVTFVFANSTYSWEGNFHTRLPEGGSGDYHREADSLFMTDCNLRLDYRCYIITDGCFRFALNKDTLRFWHEQPLTSYFLRATLIKED